eukprot:TRINITY_DN8218_c0_g2_i1.p2 TRINITY_DN8218_c0_g2~~TRINITY_DN8218_c0_g2_i1.p2  ORF type:complete len:107 (-),score=4.33 TRINITY_DN8218_c0_g2_i1:963-1283(-)
MHLGGTHNTIAPYCKCSCIPPLCTCEKISKWAIPPFRLLKKKKRDTPKAMYDQSCTLFFPSPDKPTNHHPRTCTRAHIHTYKRRESVDRNQGFKSRCLSLNLLGLR